MALICPLLVEVLGDELTAVTCQWLVASLAAGVL